MRKMGPLAGDHPLVLESVMGERESLTCAACGLRFRASEYVTLINVGPGDSREARRKAREGVAYTGVAVPVHWACATGEED